MKRRAVARGVLGSIRMRADWMVLLVEDNPADVMLVERAFAEVFTGVRVLRAGDGEQAIAALHRDVPDLVLLDLRLPDLGGLEVLAQVRRMPQHRDLPVVVMTSSPAEADRHASLGQGADVFVTKPHSYDDLLYLVRALAGIFQSGRSVRKLPQRTA